MKTEGGHTLRLVVSWYQGYQACDDAGSPNKVTVDGGGGDGGGDGGGVNDN